MENLHPENLTEILQAVESGDPDTSAKLLPLLYSERHRLAQSLMANYPTGQTLQAAALEISELNVERDWQFSRAFLLSKLTDDGL